MPSGGDRIARSQAGISGARSIPRRPSRVKHLSPDLNRRPREGEAVSLSRMIPLVRARLISGAIVCAVFLISGYLALVRTAWGHLVDNAAYFGRRVMARPVVEFDHHILGVVGIPSLALAILVILIVGALRRCMRTALLLATGFACAVAGAELLKHILPWHSLVAGDSFLAGDLQRETYPSGHTTIGTSVGLALVLVSSARWRPWLAILAGFISASFATGVLFAGWHRPSDALGGIAWSGVCMSLAAIVAITLCGRDLPAMENAPRALAATVLVIILVFALVWSVAASAGDNYPDADAPFLILTFLIISGSFALTAWFGWQLRYIDWRF
jgi:hypothetical protein